MKTSIYFIVCCLSFLTACSNKKQDTSGEEYKTLTVTQSDKTLQSVYPASLRGQQSVEIRPQISGTITDRGRRCTARTNSVHHRPSAL